MQNATELYRLISQHVLRSFESKIANANHPLGLKRLYRGAQVFVTSFKQQLLLASRQFVWSAIATGLLHERERAIVQNDMLSEKILSRAKALCE